MKTKDLVYQGKDNGLLQYKIFDSVWVLAYSRPQKIKGRYLCSISGGILIRKGVMLDAEMSELIDSYNEEFINNENDRDVVVTKNGDGDVCLRFDR